MMLILEKGRRGLPDNTIREYPKGSGKKFKKINGKWEYFSEKHGSTITEGKRKKRSTVSRNDEVKKELEWLVGELPSREYIEQEITKQFHARMPNGINSYVKVVLEEEMGIKSLKELADVAQGNCENWGDKANKLQQAFGKYQFSSSLSREEQEAWGYLSAFYSDMNRVANLSDPNFNGKLEVSGVRATKNGLSVSYYTNVGNLPPVIVPYDKLQEWSEAWISNDKLRKSTLTSLKKKSEYKRWTVEHDPGIKGAIEDFTKLTGLTVEAESGGRSNVQLKESYIKKLTKVFSQLKVGFDIKRFVPQDGMSLVVRVTGAGKKYAGYYLEGDKSINIAPSKPGTISHEVGHYLWYRGGRALENEFMDWVNDCGLMERIQKTTHYKMSEAEREQHINHTFNSATKNAMAMMTDHTGKDVNNEYTLSESARNGLQVLTSIMRQRMVDDPKGSLGLFGMAPVKTMTTYTNGKVWSLIDNAQAKGMFPGEDSQSLKDQLMALTNNMNKIDDFSRTALDNALRYMINDARIGTRDPMREYFQEKPRYWEEPTEIFARTFRNYIAMKSGREIYTKSEDERRAQPKASKDALGWGFPEVDPTKEMLEYEDGALQKLLKKHLGETVIKSMMTMMMKLDKSKRMVIGAMSKDGKRRKVAEGKWVDVPRGRKKGTEKKSKVDLSDGKTRVVDTKTQGFHVKDLDGRRFMYSPTTKEMVAGSDKGESSTTHSIEFEESRASGDFDSYLRGYIKFNNSRYPNGLITFFPAVRTGSVKEFERAIATLEMFVKKGGASKQMLVIDFGFKGETTLGELLMMKSLLEKGRKPEPEGKVKKMGKYWYKKVGKKWVYQGQGEKAGEFKFRRKSSMVSKLAIGTEVEVDGEIGKITEVNGEWLTLRYKDKKGFRMIKASAVTKVIGNDAPKVVDKAIKKADPDNRAAKVAEVIGADLKQDVIVDTGSYIFTPTDRTLTRIGLDPIVAKDYTAVLSNKVELVSAKDILTKPRPSFIPEISDKYFDNSHNRIEGVKISDNEYVIDVAIPIASYKKEKSLAVVNGAVLAATQDYYMKRQKAFYTQRWEEGRAKVVDTIPALERHLAEVVSQGNERETTRAEYMLERAREIEKMKKPKGRTGKAIAGQAPRMISAKRATYSHMGLIRQFYPETARDRNKMWQVHRTYVEDLGQKLLDGAAQFEDDLGVYTKGEETSYGDKGTKDTLLTSHGVKVKRQNGDEITDVEIKQLSDSLDEVYTTLGNRSSMARSWGLKISHSGNVMMHARKAIGLFFPAYHAIGVSYAEGGTLTLAHEFTHFMDYKIGGDNNFHYSSDDPTSSAGKIARIIQKNTGPMPGYWGRSCECFARAAEAYTAHKQGKDPTSVHGKHMPSREVLMEQIFPLVEQFLSENEEALKSVYSRTMMTMGLSKAYEDEDDEDDDESELDKEVEKEQRNEENKDKNEKAKLLKSKRTMMMKAKPYPEGTVRSWKGGKYKKTAQGWVRVSGGKTDQERGAEETQKETVQKEAKKKRDPKETAEAADNFKGYHARMKEKYGTDKLQDKMTSTEKTKYNKLQDTVSGKEPVKKKLEGSKEMLSAMNKVANTKKPVFMDDLEGKQKQVFNALTKEGLVSWRHMGSDEYRAELTEAGIAASEGAAALKQKGDRAKEEKQKQSVQGLSSWTEGTHVHFMRDIIREIDKTQPRSKAASGTDKKKAAFLRARKKEMQEQVTGLLEYVTPLPDKKLYRGTENQKWLHVQPGEEISLGLGSFSRGVNTAYSFSGGNPRIVIMYQGPPTEGIDIEKTIASIPESNKLMTQDARDMGENEEEIALRAPKLQVVKVEPKTQLSSAPGTVTLVTVKAAPMQKARKETKKNREALMEELYRDFDTPMRSKKKKGKKKS